MACRQPYRRDDYEIRCVHPHLQSPLDSSAALAYSCNYFFSKVGENLNQHQFNSTLAAFGLGSRTGAQSDAREASGSLPRTAWRTHNALGDTPELRVSPVQLIAAYAALVNGGQLFVPQQSAPHDFTPHERARLRIAPAHRALLIQGMRGAVAYGTAARAQLASDSSHIYGKTGTATTLDDFRATHGWFVGFTTGSDTSGIAPPESVGLIALVFLTGATGSDAAELARPIFEAYQRIETQHAQATLATSDAHRTAPQSFASSCAGRDARTTTHRRTRARPARARTERVDRRAR